MINKKFQKFFRHVGRWVTLRGVEGPHPFIGKNLSCLKEQLKMVIFSKFLLRRKAYGLKKIINYFKTC